MPSTNNSKNLLTQMIEELASKPAGSSVIGVDEVALCEVNKYGIIKNNGFEKIIDMVEKPSIEKAPSNLAIIGRYILQPKVFEYLEKFQIGSGGEIQLTDSLREMCKDHPFFYKKNTQKRFDCGNVLGYLEANIAFALNDDSIKEEVKNIELRAKSLEYNFYVNDSSESYPNNVHLTATSGFMGRAVKDPNKSIDDIISTIRNWEGGGYITIFLLFECEIDKDNLKSSIDFKSQIPANIISDFDKFVDKFRIPSKDKQELINIIKRGNWSEQV
jgi:NDP-sugar pyrophosphorylase family protein